MGLGTYRALRVMGMPPFRMWRRQSDIGVLVGGIPDAFFRRLHNAVGLLRRLERCSTCRQPEQ
jgi:hypothetical protein